MFYLLDFCPELSPIGLCISVSDREFGSFAGCERKDRGCMHLRSWVHAPQGIVKATAVAAPLGSSYWDARREDRRSTRCFGTCFRLLPCCQQSCSWPRSGGPRPRRRQLKWK